MKVNLEWRVRVNGTTVAACRCAEDAAAVVALYANQAAQVLWAGTVVYREGVDGVASESYDAAATIMVDRAELAGIARESKRARLAAKQVAQ